MSLRTLPLDVIADELGRWLPLPDAVNFYYRSCGHLRTECGDRAMRAAMHVVWRQVQFQGDRYEAPLCDWKTLTVPHAIGIDLHGDQLDGSNDVLCWLEPSSWSQPTPRHLLLRHADVKHAAKAVAAFQRRNASIGHIELWSPWARCDPLSTGDTGVFPSVSTVVLRHGGGSEMYGEDCAQMVLDLREIFPNARVVSRIEMVDDVARRALYVPSHLHGETTGGGDVPTASSSSSSSSSSSFFQIPKVWPDRINTLRLYNPPPALLACDESVLRSLMSRVDRVQLHQRDSTAACAGVLKYAPPRTEICLDVDIIRGVINGPLSHEAKARVTRLTATLFEGMNEENALEYIDTQPFVSVRSFEMNFPWPGISGGDRSGPGWTELQALCARLERVCRCAVYPESAFSGDWALLQLVWDTTATPQQLMDAALLASEARTARAPQPRELCYYDVVL